MTSSQLCSFTKSEVLRVSAWIPKSLKRFSTLSTLVVWCDGISLSETGKPWCFWWSCRSYPIPTVWWLEIHGNPANQVRLIVEISFMYKVFIHPNAKRWLFGISFINSSTDVEPQFCGGEGAWSFNFDCMVGNVQAPKLEVFAETLEDFSRSTHEETLHNWLESKKNWEMWMSQLTQEKQQAIC